MSALERRSGAGSILVAGAVAALAIGAWAGPAAAQDVAIVGGQVHTGSGEVIEGGTVLIRAGSVQAVGPDVTVPDGVPRFDARGKVVTPGLFDLGTQIGLVEVGLEAQTRDTGMEEDAVTAALDVLDGVNPHSTLIPVNRLGGITTVLSSPSGGLIAGRGAVLDLIGGSLGRMLVQPRAAMVANYGSGAAEAAGGSRGAASLRLREVLEDARFWRENRAQFDRGAARPLSHSRLDLEALQPVLAGETPLVVQVDRASDILAVLRIARDYGLRLVVAGGAEAWMVADSLAAADVPVVLKPLTSLPSSFDRLGARFDNAAVLHEAGVRVALSTFDTHNARNLVHEAGNAVRYGLPWEVALRGVTLEPARALGLADRYGSLEPGRVGNVVVWSGDPFELSSRAEAVVIRGEVMPEDSRQRDLFERYRTLDETAPAYRSGSP